MINTLAKIPMPVDVFLLRSLIGGLSYYGKSLPTLAKRLKPVTDLLKNRSSSEFTPDMERLARGLPRKIASLPARVSRMGCGNGRIETILAL